MTGYFPNMARRRRLLSKAYFEGMQQRFLLWKISSTRKMSFLIFSKINLGEPFALDLILKQKTRLERAERGKKVWKIVSAGLGGVIVAETLILAFTLGN